MKGLRGLGIKETLRPLRPWREVRDGAGGAMLIMIFDVFTLGFFLFGVAGSGMGSLLGHRTCRNGKTDSDDSG